MSKFDKDSLGTRMKEQYESRTRSYLPRRTYTIIRLDGCHFHTLTKKCERPFDKGLMAAMYWTAYDLCKEIQCVKFAYTQSDEISLLLTDFDTIHTEAWFNAEIQKICSVSASIATRSFNDATRNEIQYKINHEPKATFDSRAFTIADPTEVENYFIWRQQDATRNSINMLAQSLYPHKELQGVNTTKAQDMCIAKGKNWNNCPTSMKRGTCIIYSEHLGQWVGDINIPVFTQDREYLKQMIPRITG